MFDHLLVKKVKDYRPSNQPTIQRQNKAVCTTASVAYSWAGAVMPFKTDYFRGHHLSIVRSDFFNRIFWVHFFVLI